METIVTEHLNGILFHKSGSANEQHAYQSIIHATHSYWIEQNRLKAAFRQGLFLYNFHVIKYTKRVLERWFEIPEEPDIQLSQIYYKITTYTISWK